MVQKEKEAHQKRVGAILELKSNTDKVRRQCHAHCHRARRQELCRWPHAISCLAGCCMLDLLVQRLAEIRGRNEKRNLRRQEQ
jgi:hypothetical protein